MEELVPAVRPNSEPHTVARESEDWSPHFAKGNFGKLAVMIVPPHRFVMKIK